MEKYINEHNKECFRDVETESNFSENLFHKPEYQEDDGENFAFHSNLGSLTVVDRMTGFGWRDIESGYRAIDGKFWLASGHIDVRFSKCKTVGEAIEYVKQYANTCIPE